MRRRILIRGVGLPGKVRYEKWRTLILLHPFELPMALCLFAVAVVFTVFPEALEHSAISFETRGLWHHLGFHYPLLFGSLAVVVGLIMTVPRGLVIELAGMLLLLIAIMLNLTAVVATEFDPVHEDPSGLGIALRAGVMIGLAARAWIIVKRPTITMTASRDA